MVRAMLISFSRAVPIVLWNILSIVSCLNSGYEPLDKNARVGWIQWIFPWMSILLTLGCLSRQNIFVLVVLSLTSIGSFIWSVKSNAYQFYNVSSKFERYFMRWVLPMVFLLIHSYLWWSGWTRTDYFDNIPVSVILLDEHHPAFSNPFVQSNGSIQSLEFANERYPSHSYMHDERLGHRFLSTTQGIANFENFYGIRFDLTPGQDIEKHKVYETKPIPWPSYYWPKYQDALNYNYEKDLHGADRPKNPKSIIQKYALEFGYSPRAFADQYSRISGLDNRRTGLRCKSDNDCKRHVEGEVVCGIRSGFETGICVYKWCGLCDLWSSATIMFPKEPKHSVTMSRSTFTVQDQKGLLTQIMYDNVYTMFVGKKCQQLNPAADVDEFGRMKDEKCRDINPGLLHIIMYNVVGILKKSFIIDRDATSAIWNHPVRSFKVRKRKVLKERDAAQKVSNGKLTTYQFNPHAHSFEYFKVDLSYINDDHIVPQPTVNTPLIDDPKYTETMTLEYVLELDRHGKIMGGEWVGKSKVDHPDFMWLPTKMANRKIVSGIDVNFVRSLYQKGTQ